MDHSSDAAASDRADTGPDEQGPVEIADERQLFVDEYIVGQRSGVHFETHRPTSRERVLTLDRPWEGPTSWCPVVLHDGDVYRMWYRASGEDHGFLAYAESEDGIEWQRPSLGLVSFDGSTDNNILPQDGPGGNTAVFRDNNPEAPADERYKAIDRTWYQDEPSELWGYTSRNGIEWETVGDDPLVTAPEDDLYFDSPASAFWDADEGQYVVYIRGQYPDGGNHRIRAVRFATSPDFRDWSSLEFVSIEDDSLWREHLYTNAAQRYYRAPYYLMFPKRFTHDRKYVDDWPHDGQSDVLMLASRDGEHWVRPYDGAFLRPGRDERNWHDRAICVAQDAVPTSDGEMSLYSVQHYRTEDVHIRRFTLREDGFVSARAGRQPGELVTRPLSFEGDRLEVNFATSGAGAMTVELQDAGGTPVAGYRNEQCEELFGDEIDRVVSWDRSPDGLEPRDLDGDSDVGPLEGHPIRVRFELREADLYSFRFRSG